MESVQSFQSALDAIATNGHELLQQFNHDHEIHGSAESARSADRHVASSQLPRKKLIEAATKLMQLAIRPEEYLDKLANNYQELSCVRWLVDLNVLQHIPEHGYISYSQLAAAANVPESQLKGVSRMAVVNGFLEEPLPEHVAHSRPSSLLARDANFKNWANWMVNYSVPVAYKFADATRRWGNTDAKNETAFNLALDTPDPFFDHLRKVPQLTAIFSGYMRNVTASWPWSLKHAVDGFDWASLPEGATVVDVGGSHGQLAVQVARKYPHLKFIVQDLPETVATAQKAFDADDSVEASIKSRIRFMCHDFFQPQPVTDARVYFLRMIIHDWPDRDALVILKHLHAVLEVNPSARVVLMDTVLPPPGSTSILHEQQLRVRDLMMMQVFNARERELADWRSLADRAGLQVAGVHSPSDSVMGILTAELSQPAVGDAESAPFPLSRRDSPLDDRADLPVLIVGAGMSGLCLAQALEKANIPFQVFERDAAVDSRPQGYRLKLQSDAGQAMAETLPGQIYAHAFEKSCANTSIGETDLNPFTGAVIKSRAGGGLSGKLGLYQSYTVDRTAFRTSLMKGIEDRIFFGKELTSFETDHGRGIVTVTFKDGQKVEGRFLVGADGLHSIVRRHHLPDSKIVDTGATCIYGKTPLATDVAREFPAKGLRWMTVVSDQAPMLQSCLIGDASVTLLLEPIRWTEESRSQLSLPPDYLYWALIGPEERFRTEKPTTPAELTLSLSQEWHPSIRSVFEHQEVEQATTIRVASSIAQVPTWKSSSLVTLLGDAVHPMSPCGGVGANTAICDAASLAKVFVASSGRPTSKDIAAFEDDMRQRASKSILRAELGSKKMFGLRSLADCRPWVGL
ncbi:Dual O-methyltransferase/FAD-dependent monooxygenase CTB3 [Pseudocercospora fuligena]|uniref:Dual O-methyltransferase/FAD-dependent monooxygenase CTB3 n=1 Tax=Pseudocercospora fuligena TaxID=685502 RepID=A0A8H6RVK3_9PEZI|nr:Dual O-methyltransferase/FAD-dependent monooxygenase CTB3 [Pseudocercospora fuligena]